MTFLHNHLISVGTIQALQMKRIPGRWSTENKNFSSIKPLWRIELRSWLDPIIRDRISRNPPRRMWACISLQWIICISQ